MRQKIWMQYWCFTPLSLTSCWFVFNMDFNALIRHDSIFSELYVVEKQTKLCIFNEVLKLELDMKLNTLRCISSLLTEMQEYEDSVRHDPSSTQSTQELKWIELTWHIAPCPCFLFSRILVVFISKLFYKIILST